MSYDISRGKLQEMVEILFEKGQIEIGNNICLLHAEQGFHFLRELYIKYNTWHMHPYTLPSRSKSPTHEPKLVKEYGCLNTRKKKARAYNNIYKSLGNKCLNWRLWLLINDIVNWKFGAIKCPTPHILNVIFKACALTNSQW